jgi:hypothetical protein
MPRRPMTATERQAASARMKRAWKTRRRRVAEANHVTPAEPASNAATSVDHRIILHAAGSDLLRSVEEARHLRDALSQALPTP